LNDLLELFELTAVFDRVAGSFSHGMARRLSVVLAALTAEQVLVLDEPFDGVDPTGVDATLMVIGDARTAGLAVLISTHLLDLAVQACDTITVMTGGELAAPEPATQFHGAGGARRYQQMLRRPE
jgi:ABC-2 type transport system ATP-binding protein